MCSWLPNAHDQLKHASVKLGLPNSPGSLAGGTPSEECEPADKRPAAIVICGTYKCAAGTLRIGPGEPAPLSHIKTKYGTVLIYRTYMQALIFLSLMSYT
jgi:hypothetical protein